MILKLTVILEFEGMPEMPQTSSGIASSLTSYVTSFEVVFVKPWIINYE